MAGCTPKGRGYVGCLSIGVLLIIAGAVLEGLGTPNGDLGLYYQIDACRSEAASFTVAGRGSFHAYVMRGAPDSGDPPATACPTAITPAGPTSITLEEDDGYRGSASYAPVLVLPRSSYAALSVSIKDQTGKILFPLLTLSLGPNDNYPWMVEPSAIIASSAAASAGPEPAAGQKTSTAGSGACACSNTCAYSSDGSCDDGGAGSEYSACKAGEDCADCSSRCSSSSSRRLLFGAAASAGAAAPADPRRGDEAELDGGGSVRSSDMDAPPGSRRLLKGGSSSSSSSSGGGSYSSGSAYSSGSSGARSRSDFTSTATRRTTSPATTTRTYGSHTYGGRSSYSVGGTNYYYGSRRYSYGYAGGW